MEWGQSNRWRGAYDAHDCAKREKRIIQIARTVSLGAVFALRPDFGLEGRVNRHGLLVYWTCVHTSAHNIVSYMITAHRRWSFLLLRPTGWFACWLATFSHVADCGVQKDKKKACRKNPGFLTLCCHSCRLLMLWLAAIERHVCELVDQLPRP